MAKYLADGFEDDSVHEMNRRSANGNDPNDKLRIANGESRTAHGERSFRRAPKTLYYSGDSRSRLISLVCRFAE